MATIAEHRIALAKQQIESAGRDLDEVIFKNCEGSNRYTDEYWSKLHAARLQLKQVLELL